MVYRRDNTRTNSEGKFILLIQVTKITKTSSSMQGESWRHQRLRQHHVKESSPKPAFAEIDESTRQRIDFSTHRIEKGHIAENEKNSVVCYKLFAKQVKPRKRPNVTLRKRRGHKSYNALRLPSGNRGCVAEVRLQPKSIRESQLTRRGKRTIFFFVG